MSNIYFEGRSLFIRPDKHPPSGGRGGPVGRGGYDAPYGRRSGPPPYSRGSVGYGGYPAVPPDPFTDNVVGDGEKSETIYVRNVSFSPFLVDCTRSHVEIG